VLWCLGRFIVVTDGAILESVGSFENMRLHQLPKGACQRGSL
jgi:hypothetical protein